MNNQSIILSSLALILLLIFAGCVKPTTPPIDDVPGNGDGGETPLPSSGWLAYAPVQADTNPWQTYQSGLNSGKSELEQVNAWLEGNGIPSPEYGFIPNDEVVCAALNCPRGDYLIIQTTDEKTNTFLRTNGFFDYQGVGVYVKPSSISENNIITIVNALEETIFYGGCNEYTPILVTSEGEIPGPLKNCIWEGIPIGLDAGETDSYPFGPGKDGTYYIDFSYGIGCIPQKPMSEAQCTSGGNASSLLFEADAFGPAKYVKMQYEIKQCRTNPWQEPESTATPEEDLADFKEWLNDQKITPTTIQYIPPAEGLAVCLACSCGQGDYYQITIPASQQNEAEDEGFTYLGVHVPAGETPSFADAQWYVTSPFQCYANKWNVEKKPIHSAATDIAILKEWLEGQGVNVAYTTYLPGFTLTKECLKKSTDVYGIGVADDESAALMQSLGFPVAGKSQEALFTDTTKMESLTLIYKSKFCTTPPWGQPELSNGNEAESASEAAEWLAMKGMDVYAGPTIHKIGASFSGTCDTDSGMAVKVSVPAWAKPHLLAQGFSVPSYSFEQQQEQVYPVVEEME